MNYNFLMLKPKQLTLLLLFFGSCYTSAQENIKEQVLKFEQDRCTATVEKNIALLNEMISDDLQYTHSRGRVETKDDYINNLKTNKSTYNEIKLSDTKIRVYGSTAITNGNVFFDGIGVSGRYSFFGKYSAVYVKQDSKWLMVNWQTARKESELIAVASLTAFEGKGEELFKVLKENQKLTLENEKGCVIYEINRSIEDSKSFVLYEKWRNMESFKLHFKMPYMEKWAKIRDEHIEIRDIKILKKQ